MFSKNFEKIAREWRSDAERMRAQRQGISKKDADKYEQIGILSDPAVKKGLIGAATLGGGVLLGKKLLKRGK